MALSKQEGRASGRVDEKSMKLYLRGHRDCVALRLVVGESRWYGRRDAARDCRQDGDAGSGTQEQDIEAKPTYTSKSAGEERKRLTPCKHRRRRAKGRRGEERNALRR